MFKDNSFLYRICQFYCFSCVAWKAKKLMSFKLFVICWSFSINYFRLRYCYCNLFLKTVFVLYTFLPGRNNDFLIIVVVRMTFLRTGENRKNMVCLGFLANICICGPSISFLAYICICWPSVSFKLVGGFKVFSLPELFSDLVP